LANLPGVTVTQYEPHELDRCNLQCTKREKGRADKVECGVTDVTCVIVTDAEGRGVLLRLCRHHLYRLATLLIEDRHLSTAHTRSDPRAARSDPGAGASPRRGEGVHRADEGARTRREALPHTDALPSGRGRPVDFSTTELWIFFEIRVPECPRRACLQVAAARRDG
jgi:hypothetical protein